MDFSTATNPSYAMTMELGWPDVEELEIEEIEISCEDAPSDEAN